MNQRLAREIRTAAEELAKNMSRPRNRNTQSEEFEVNEIIPLSDNTAGIIFLKIPSMKKALAFAYYLRMGEMDPMWKIFFVGDSHIIGMRKVEALMDRVNRENFDKNFEEEEREPGQEG